MKLEGSKTEANLRSAFAGESQACVKYGYFASQAKKDGFIKIQQLFTEAAQNEKEHAKIWFKKLHGGSVPKTADNLRDATRGEHGEWTQMYREFAETAKAEGFDEIAALFEKVGDIEQHHEQLYQEALASIESGSIFHQETPVYWICTNCGHVTQGLEPPERCPVCDHARDYFVIQR